MSPTSRTPHKMRNVKSRLPDRTPEVASKNFTVLENVVRSILTAAVLTAFSFGLGFGAVGLAFRFAALVHAVVVVVAQSRGVHQPRDLLFLGLFLEIAVVVHGAFGVVLERGLVEEVAEFVDAGTGEDAEDFALMVGEFYEIG